MGIGNEMRLGIGNEILDMIYPKSIYCLCCGKIIDESMTYSLCDKCIRDIHWADKTCEKCGRPLTENWMGKLCATCMEREVYFDKGYSCCQYGAHARAIIFAYKYGDKPYIAHHISEAMLDRLRLALPWEWDLISFVPTEKDKAKERGFDHAQLLAELLAKDLGLPEKKMLVRKKKTIPQRGLTLFERQDNVRGAFEVVRKDFGAAKSFRLMSEQEKIEQTESLLQGKKLLLIDDIFTTGSTINECARVLKAAGARGVDFATFAATANRHY